MDKFSLHQLELDISSVFGDMGFCLECFQNEMEQLNHECHNQYLNDKCIVPHLHVASGQTWTF